MLDKKDCIILVTCAVLIASIAFTPFILIEQHTRQTHTLHQLLNQTTSTAIYERDILQNTLLTLFTVADKEQINKVVGNGTHFIIYDNEGTIVGIVKDIVIENVYENRSNLLPIQMIANITN